MQAALSDSATGGWGELWDHEWAASDGGWQQHCGSPERLSQFTEWLSEQKEQHIAVVSHAGTINNWMNRQPWAAGRPRWPWPSGNYDFGPEGGVARKFSMPNCGWVAVMLEQ